jgi:ribonuclease-3
MTDGFDTPEHAGTPTVVFETASDIEASVVLALLDSHGIGAFRASGNPQAIWPLAVTSLGRIQVAVASPLADEARRIIDSHREPHGPRVVWLKDALDELQGRIGYQFANRELLEQALTHRSRAAEDAARAGLDNESLEFLGDAVLGFVVADWLFRQFPAFDEGQKSKIKASVVSTQSLARHAEGVGLGEHLILGKGEEKTGGREKPALLADAFEALVAAIFIDGGLEPAAAFLWRELKADVEAGEHRTMVDHKSSLQERLQRLGRPLPTYRLAGAAGPDHQKRFVVEVVIGGAVRGTADGRSKKEAEQEAARLALLALDADGPEGEERRLSRGRPR